MPGSINRSFLLAVASAALIAAPAIAKDKSKSPTPTGNPGMWFTDDDYPPAARRANQQGRVALEISIDAGGVVRGCLVVTSSGSPVLDETSCRLVRERGKFDPARDADGRPVAGTYKISTRWALRTPGPFALVAPWYSAQLFNIDATGKIVSCTDKNVGDSGGVIIAPCASWTRVSAQIGLSMRNHDPRPGVVDMVFETATNFDGGTQLPMAYEAPNRIVSGLMVMHFDVDTDGTVKNCKAVVQTGSFTRGDPCAVPPGPYTPQATMRGVTVKIATSYPPAG